METAKPEFLGTGYIKEIGNNRSVGAWCCKNGETVFTFRNGEKLTHIRLSKEALEALKEAIWLAPKYISAETIANYKAEQELMLAS